MSSTHYIRTECLSNESLKLVRPFFISNPVGFLFFRQILTRALHRHALLLLIFAWAMSHRLFLDLVTMVPELGCTNDASSVAFVYSLMMPVAPKERGF